MAIKNDITAACNEVILGDKSYRISPLTDKDISELDNWLRIQTIRLARESVLDADAATQDHVMKLALEFASTITWMSPQGSALMGTIDGVGRLIWQSIKKEHPEMTPEAVRELILDSRTLSAALDAFDMINGVKTKESGKAAKGKAKKSVAQKSIKP